MGLKVQRERLTDRIELFEAVDGVDGLERPTKIEQSRGEVYGFVDMFSGSRLLRYKELGFINPATIRIFDPKFTVMAISYNGKKAAVRSTEVDKQNTDYIRVYVDFLT